MLHSRGCSHGGGCQWVRLHQDLVLELCQVHLELVADALLPPVLKVEEYVFTHVSLAGCGLRNISEERAYSIRQACACLCLLEPRLELFVEFPVLLLQLHCCQVLLIRSLLVVKRKEQCLQVEPGEVFLAVEQWHGRVVVHLADCAWVLRVDHFLVLGRRHVRKGRLKQRKNV